MAVATKPNLAMPILEATLALSWLPHGAKDSPEVEGLHQLVAQISSMFIEVST
jgi:hypothetical protein